MENSEYELQEELQQEQCCCLKGCKVAQENPPADLVDTGIIMGSDVPGCVVDPLTGVSKHHLGL